MFARTCQECDHIQEAIDPKGNPTDAYRDAKCKKCKSRALDYGHDAHKLVNGRIVHDNEDNWAPDPMGAFRGMDE